MNDEKINHLNLIKLINIFKSELNKYNNNNIII